MVECVIELVEYNGVEWLWLTTIMRSMCLQIMQVPMYASENVHLSIIIIICSAKNEKLSS